MLKPLLCLILLLTAVSMSAFAQTQAAGAPTNADARQQEISPAKAALVKELMEISFSKASLQDMFKTMFESMAKEMPKMIRDSLSNSSKELTEAEQEKLQKEITESSVKASQRFTELFLQKLDYDRLINEVYAPLYAKYFNEAELQELINFNKSAVAKRMQEVMPQLLADSVSKSGEIIGPLMQEIQKEIQSGETEKFQKQVDAIVESHHQKSKSPGRSKRRP